MRTASGAGMNGMVDDMTMAAKGRGYLRVICLSDTHNQHSGITLPEGDVLIHAGDGTGGGTYDEVERFLAWFGAQPFAHRILIAGNHDWLFQESPDLIAMLLVEHPGVTYLQDSGVVINGVHFWGSPWQPEFMSWAFNLPRRGVGIRKVWNRVPMDTDVLVTHGPPYGILDAVPGGSPLGCEELKIRLAAVKPRVHCFGHIHAGWGVARSETTVYINASTCDEDYRPSHRPIVVDIGPGVVKVLGADPSPRRRQVAAIKAALGATQGNPAAIQAMQIQAALKGMAELRGMTDTELVQDYVQRGLQADLKKLERAEAKPGKVPVPIRMLKG